MKLYRHKFLILNNVAFQCCWLGLVFWQSSFIPVALFWLCAHLYFVSERRHELQLMAKIAGLGVIIDTVLMYVGVFSFPNGSLILPAWLIVLWMCFSSTIRHSLSFISRFPRLIPVIGAIAFPFSYFVGKQSGAVSFGVSTELALLVIATIWFFCFQTIFRFAAIELQNPLKSREHYG